MNDKGLPIGASVPSFGFEPLIFLGHLYTPSGLIRQEKNSYILDISPKFGVIESVSGYIDGVALAVTVLTPNVSSNGIDKERTNYTDDGVVNGDDVNQDGDKVELSRTQERRLDENPSACGHFINHSPEPNVSVHPFVWKDIFPDYQPGSTYTYDLPNISRTDGGIRYIIYNGSEMIFYDVDEPSFKVDGVCGAVICADTDIAAGKEIMRDYELEEPLPDWAKDWYVFSPDADNPRKVDDDRDSEKWRLT
jgi:hypothetical protein